MNISGIRPSDGFYDNKIRKYGPELNAAINASLENQDTASNYDRDVAASLTISEAGKAADKKVEKAVINMEKDTTIHRYQYFVQNKPSTDNQDKELENFSL